jgi:phage tail protein X
MTGYLKYITLQDERWDQIAWQFYGDATLYGPIIEANPGVPIVGAFDAGVEILVPILQKASDASSDLPPWKTL